MKSVLEEINTIRKGVPMTIDPENSNRYRLVTIENNGSKTAYYFSAPIYNQSTRKLVDLQFKSNREELYALGSNATITISNNIRLENAEGACTISLSNNVSPVSINELSSGSISIHPTTNGVAIKADVAASGKYSFTLEVDQPFLPIRANDRCFSLMLEQFRPLIVISCIGSMDSSGNIIGPSSIQYQKLTDTQFCITIIPSDTSSKYILLEANMYENKLFQDTTVESKNPETNNAFGGTCFIGNTSQYGEQWLYSRPDYTRMSEIMDKRAEKAVLYIPKLSHSTNEFKAFKVSARFCSFGSRWNNKIPGEVPVSASNTLIGYQSIDLSTLILDRRINAITYTEGFILKPTAKNNSFSVLATGDSYYTPQILAINFR